MNRIATCYYYLLIEDGAVQDEGMKLSILAACIDSAIGLIFKKKIEITGSDPVYREGYWFLNISEFSLQEE